MTRPRITLASLWMLGALVAAGACSAPAAQRPASDPEPTGPHDSRTAIEQRRDAACDALGPRITRCAVEDARKAAAAGEITQKQLDDISAPEIQRKNTGEFLDKCKVEMSSRQVRVLEVCQHEETACDPLISCLEHLHEPAH